MTTLTDNEVNTLARYNGEVSRGLRHTPEWKARMRELQRRFNEETRANPCIVYVGADEVRTTQTRSSKT